MCRTTNYIALNERSPLELSNTVRRMLADGWEPQGGVSVTWNAGGFLYAQAMVKKEQK